MLLHILTVGHHPKIHMNKRIVSDLHLPYTCILPGTNHERGIRLQLTNFGQRHWKRIRVDAVKVSSGKRVRVKLERHEGYSSSEDGKGGSRFELVFPQLNGIKTGRYMLEFRFAQHWWHRPRLQYRSAPMVIFVSQGAAKVQDTLVSALDKVLPDEVNEWLRFGGCRRDTRMLGSSVKTWSKKVKKLPAAIDKHILEPGMNGVKAIAEPIKDVYGDVKDATNNAGDFCRHVLMPTAIGAYRGLKYRRKGYSPGKA